MTDHSTVDESRRRFLTTSSMLVGGTGAVGAIWPFIASMSPSARVRTAGAPVEVDLSRLQPGQRISLIWRKRPVWIIRRTPEMLTALDTNQDRLRDPNSDNRAQQPEVARNGHRSLSPEFLVLEGVCTHLGCNPSYRPEVSPADLGRDWSGGFFCACHGSRFDLAGRVYANVPANANLRVPPYRFVSETRILIGELPDESTG